MTNTEAIETLQLARAEVEWEYSIDIAAAIDKAIAALERDRWISVKDKLPEQNGLTMIALREGHVGICYFAGGWWGGYERESITHWKPLPEPPEEDKP